MTRRALRIAFVALCAAAARPIGAAAQAPPDSMRSTLAGVYTSAQAARGRETFAGLCQSCHSPDTHTGPAFTANWGVQPLSRLFLYISENMPQTDPGTLTPEQYAQVLAYILQMNGLPAGQRELPANVKELRLIRFDTASTTPANGGRSP
jgi:mono/diheme cytochrome c family protein